MAANDPALPALTLAEHLATRQHLTAFLNTLMSRGNSSSLPTLVVGHETSDFSGPNVVVGSVRQWQEVTEAFVSQNLLTYPERQQPLAVRIFASCLPLNMTIEDQDDLGSTFDSSVQHISPPAEFLVDIIELFYDHLPVPVELQSPVESEEEDEAIPQGLVDVVVPPPRLFPWFETRSIVYRPRPIEPAQVVLSWDDAIVHASLRHQRWRDIARRGADLEKLKEALYDAYKQIQSMIEDTRDDGDALRNTALNLLALNIGNLQRLHVAREPLATEIDVANTVATHTAATGMLTHVLRMMTFAEAYLVRCETDLLARRDNLRAQASRYERSRYRFELKSIVVYIRDDDLHQSAASAMRYTPQPEPVACEYDRSEIDCSICSDHLPYQVEAACEVCRKPFCVKCILPWAFERYPDMKCPLCRAVITNQTLGDLLEQRVRQLQVL